MTRLIIELDDGKLSIEMSGGGKRNDILAFLGAMDEVKWRFIKMLTEDDENNGVFIEMKKDKGGKQNGNRMGMGGSEEGY